MATGKVRGLVGRIGGPERLREILHRFYQQLFEDPIVGFFFDGQDLDKIVSGQHAFLMRAFQETERFTGVHPGKAHVDLPPIRRGQFDRRLAVLREVLTAEGLDPADVDAWVKVEEGMRRLIEKKR
ncbi:MAG: globin domain-containing protein [Planctomycetota bacterium]|jgi:truncated hemoglobin YjbI